MGESDRPDEERMHQIFKEEVEEWVDQVVEGLGIFAQGDLQAEGERDGKRDDFSKSVSKILNICESMRNLLQPGEEEVETEEQEALVGRTRESLEEIQRLLGDFCRLAEEEYGNRGEEVPAAVREIIKEVEARLEKGEEDQAATVLRENWGRLIEASGGDGHEWEDWRRRLEAAREKVEEARNKVKEAEKKLEQAREVEQKAREEREKVLASLLWRNEQWEQAMKEFGRIEKEHVAKPDVEALQRELETLDRRVTAGQEHRKVRENELETARRELENWNPEFERMTQSLEEARKLRAWVLTLSESDDAEKELSKARRKQTDCELRQILAEGSSHLAAATQGVDAAEREFEEAMEEWERARDELKRTEEKLEWAIEAWAEAIEKWAEEIEKWATASKEWAEASGEWATAIEKWLAANEKVRWSRRAWDGPWEEARKDWEEAREEWKGAEPRLNGARDIPWGEAKKKLEGSKEAWANAKEKWERASELLKRANKKWHKEEWESIRRTAAEACQGVQTCEQAFAVARQRRATSAQVFIQASRRRQALEQLRHLWNRVPNESPAVDTAPASASDAS